MSEDNSYPNVVRIGTNVPYETIDDEGGGEVDTKPTTVPHYDTSTLIESLPEAIESMITVAMDVAGNITSRVSSIHTEYEILAMIDLFHAKFRDDILSGEFYND